MMKMYNCVKKSQNFCTTLKYNFSARDKNE